MPKIILNDYEKSQIKRERGMNAFERAARIAELAAKVNAIKRGESQCKIASYRAPGEITTLLMARGRK